MAWYTRKPKPEPALEPQVIPVGLDGSAIIAAATRLTNDFGFGQTIRRSSWQNEAWRQYNLSGELRYATAWLANSLSRVRLYVAEVDDAGKVIGECKDEAVIEMMSDLLGDPAAVADMMHEAGLNLAIAGDLYLVEMGPSEWIVVSTEEISEGAPGFVNLDLGGQQQFTLDLSEHTVVRIHRPHPRRWSEADSPTRGALPILRELEELGKYIFATINSRLAGAGILGIASEISAAVAAVDQQPGEDPFMASFAEAALTPISDPGSPSAVIPMVIRGPKDALPSQDNWLFHPGSELTTVVSELRVAALTRLAISLDLPAEVLLGTADASRWATWQTEESSIKVNIEPLAILIADAITRSILLPRLAEAELDSDYVIWIDSTELVQRPDRSPNALTANERNLLSDEATRRELGFAEQDAPTGDEKVIKELIQLIQIAPQTADVLAPILGKLLGFDIPEVAPPDGTPKNNDPAAPDPNSRPLPANE